MGSDKKPIDGGLRLIWGVILAGICLCLALSLFSYDWKDISLLQAPQNSAPYNLFGVVGAWLSFVLFMGLGIGAYLVPLFCIVWGTILMTQRESRAWPRVLWCAVLLLAAVAAIQLSGASWTATLAGRLNILPDVGGVFGRVVVRNVLERWLSRVGAGIVAWVVFAVGLLMVVRIANLVLLGKLIARGYCFVANRIHAYWMERQDKLQQIEREERLIERRRRHLEKTIKNGKSGKEPSPSDPEAIVKAEPELIPTADETPAEPVREKPKIRKEKPPKKASPPVKITEEAEPEESGMIFILPSSEMLESPAIHKNEGVVADTDTTAKVLVETLAEFGIEGEITNAEVGPVVTSYELLPAPGVRVERISGLSNNLALSLKATSVRVQAPIPGKGVVGIEVPNSVSKMVRLREMIEGPVWQSGRAHLPLALGKDVSGEDIIADLSAMPHLLIAGATGSGKTVCMNSILTGLLMSRTPEELRLLLVDPKIVEFSAYNHLPHLVVPVVTDPKKVALGLRWAINEMEKRYKLFARTGVRNIESYNHREVAKQEDLFAESMPAGEPKNEPPERIPYIVIVIDELADLMLAAQADIENCIARLAQLSRAVGIHMIIATQRPSVNVITGTIKANFPARIAFQVAQRVDSRTILDTVGADKLLGRGDMLFLPPGSSKVVRAQGAMTTDAEIRRVTEFIRQQGEPHYEVAIKQKLEESSASRLDEEGLEDEAMINQAISIIQETRRASTSSLQRRLRIGYTRAARIMDILEERGILGPPRGAEPREILIDLDGEIPDNSGEREEGAL